MQRENASTRSLVPLDGWHQDLLGGNVAVDGWVNVSFREASLEGEPLYDFPEHPTPFIYTVEAAAAESATNVNSSRHREILDRAKIDTLCREVSTLRSHLVVAHDHIERLEHMINAKNAELLENEARLAGEEYRLREMKVKHEERLKNLMTTIACASRMMELEVRRDADKDFNWEVDVILNRKFPDPRDLGRDDGSSSGPA